MATNGPDLITGTRDADRLSGLAGDDTIYGAGGDDGLSGGDDNDWLYGGEGLDFLSGGAGADHLSGGDFSDVLDGGLGDDTIDGGAGRSGGADTARYASATAGVTVRLDMATAQDTHGAGLDTLIGIENLDGSGFDDDLRGGDGDNLITGGAGNDTLGGGLFGVDTLDGGSGVDTTAAYDGLSWDGVRQTWVGTIFESPTIWTYDVLTDIEIVPVPRAGTVALLVDTLSTGGFGSVAEAAPYALDHYYIDVAPGVADVTVEINADDLTINTWDPSTGVITLGSSVTSFSLAGNAQVRVVGNGLNNTIHASAAPRSFGDPASRIEGGAGDDYLDAGSYGSNETFAGGAGDDTIDGGTYFNFASYADASAAVRVSLATTSSQNTGGAGRDKLIGIDGLIGSGFDDRLTGDQMSNSLAGGDGADTIDGGSLGADTIDGGAGADVVDGGYGDDRIVDTDGISGDTLRGGFDVDRLDYSGASLGAGVVIDLQGGLVTKGRLIETVTGFENLVGSKTGETILGTAGANRIDGFNGADTILGGKGADTLLGGANNDRLDGGAGDDSADGGAGADTVVADLGNDILTGGDGVDLLDGSTATANVAIDLSTTGVQNTLAFGSDTLSGIENVSTGEGADQLTGDDAANLFSSAGGADRVTSGTGADTIRAGAGNDLIDGGADTDLLVGGLGRDTMTGGAGADVFDFDATAESSVGKNLADAIVDFSHAEGDLIDLSDVSAGLLSYVGEDRFHAAGVGEVRLRTLTGGEQWIQVDADGDGISDMDLIVSNAGVVDQTDFVL